MEGYIGDFNNMVRDLWQIMGDIGVEVLPYVPVVYAGLDDKGGELLAGVKNWIEWVSEQKGRRSIGELAKTGGTETGWRESSNVIHIQAELCEHDKQGKRKGGGGAGLEE